ncbi:MAG: hypothetical protein MUC92_13480, partial [Fimbriimonadaceae bacterium]|nr:hypothetical protein [Fimbriimonadaceae bacterium]
PLQDDWGWYKLDLASPYMDFLIEQTQEVCNMLGDELDGVFFDILFQAGVHSEHCLKRFEEQGWDPKDKHCQRQMRRTILHEATGRLHDAVRSVSKTCSIFHNSGHVDPSFRTKLSHFSHLELESLPTGGWGYMHFPITARYARTLDMPFLGMTGRFSESWGHFGSYKNQAALEYECFSALALGGGCSVGDQLHPSGKIDQATYSLIGSVYQQIAEVEPWCKGANGVAEIAVLLPEEPEDQEGRIDPRCLGVARMLIEGAQQFDFADQHSDWSQYTVLVIPEANQEIDEEKLSDYLRQGGKVIAAGDAVINSQGAIRPSFSSAIKAVKGELPYSPDYLRLQPVSGLSSDTNHVMYDKGKWFEAQEDAEIWATITEPFFNRAWNHFCSHAHTPPSTETEKPGLIVSDQVAVFSHPIFGLYAKHSVTVYRDLFLRAVKRFLPVPLVQRDGPSSLQAHVTEGDQGLIVHLLHYIPERRGLMHDIIEEGMIIQSGEIRIRTERETAMLIPEGLPLETKREDEVLVVHFPTRVGKMMICIH